MSSTTLMTPSIWQRLLAMLKPNSGGESILKILLHSFGPPMLGIFIFLAIWDLSASRVHTSLGTLPGPVAVIKQAGNLYQQYLNEQEREHSFNERQKVRKAEFLAEHPGEKYNEIKYTGQPTYLDQIFTSLYTVFVGFMLGTIIAVPLGILSGLNKTIRAALNPLIQIFRPVSPLAWLPIGLLVFKAANPAAIWVIFISSIWPIIINTAVGVSRVPQDYLNVAKVLNLSEWKVATRILLPAALPYILTGIRLSIGVAWLVIVAAEMLTGGVGIGFWVWDEWNNLNVEHIIIAIFVVGIVGLLLEQMLLFIAKRFSYEYKN